MKRFTFCSYCGASVDTSNCVNRIGGIVRWVLTVKHCTGWQSIRSPRNSVRCPCWEWGCRVPCVLLPGEGAWGVAASCGGRCDLKCMGN